MPAVSSREPLWDERDALSVVTGLRTDRREVIVTTLSEAQPDTLESSPRPSIWPFAAAMVAGVTLLGSIFTAWAVTIGAIPIAITLVGWFWPKGNKEDES
jgi:cytochrome c oxidase subunit 1